MTTENRQPSFFIRNIPIYGNLILAPMDGISDHPFRSLTRRLGSALTYTEFINARDVINGHPHLEQRLFFTDFERPVAYQLFDDDPDRLVEAALRLEFHQPDVFDLNLGCSARCVTSRGAGSALLKNPAKIALILSSLVKRVQQPISAKIRLGWDENSRNYLEIAKILQENGASLLAVHARTKAQKYSGEADWDAIAEIKNIVSIPVIANGDVRTVADIEKVKTGTGCDGIMIGRAAVANPWLFSHLDRHQVPNQVITTTLITHLKDMMDFYGPALGIRFFRKYCKRILTPAKPDPDLLHQLLTSHDSNEVGQLIQQILSC